MCKHWLINQSFNALWSPKMKEIADLFLFFIFCAGFNNTRSEESTTSNSIFQPKGRMVNRRMHKMVCASADYPLPISGTKFSHSIYIVHVYLKVVSFK